MTHFPQLGVLVMERVFPIKELGGPDVATSKDATTQRPVEIPPHPPSLDNSQYRHTVDCLGCYPLAF